MSLLQIFNEATTAMTTAPSVVPSEPVVDPTTVTEAASNGISNSELLNTALERLVDWATTTGIKVLISLIVMIVVFKIIDVFTKSIYKRLAKKKADYTLSKVLVSAIRITLKLLVIIAIIGYLGFETASLSAVVASLGVGLSLALQGTLSNFAGGIIVVIMRPFKIGDFITSNGQAGTVEDIKLFYTHVITPDNRVVYIPNGQLANNVIVNNSVKETRRVEVVMSISYESSTDLAKNLAKKLVTNYDLVLKDQPIFAEVGEYNDSSIDIKVRCWCKNSDYWTVYFYLLDNIKKEYEANGITIPYNKLDVTILNNNALEAPKAEEAQK